MLYIHQSSWGHGRKHSHYDKYCESWNPSSKRHYKERVATRCNYKLLSVEFSVEYVRRTDGRDLRSFLCDGPQLDVFVFERRCQGKQLDQKVLTAETRGQILNLPVL